MILMHVTFCIYRKKLILFSLIMLCVNFALKLLSISVREFQHLKKVTNQKFNQSRFLIPGY